MMRIHPDARLGLHAPKLAGSPPTLTKLRVKARLDAAVRLDIARAMPVSTMPKPVWWTPEVCLLGYAHYLLALHYVSTLL